MVSFSAIRKETRRGLKKETTKRPIGEKGWEKLIAGS